MRAGGQVVRKRAYLAAARAPCPATMSVGGRDVERRLDRGADWIAFVLAVAAAAGGVERGDSEHGGVRR
eukprot:994856-Pyramimonas_sp.AAC.1